MDEIPTLATERLILRPFNASDAPAVERLAGTREVAHTTLAIPHPYPVGGGAVWIATHAGEWDRSEALTLAICDPATPSNLLGAISLHFSTTHLHGEVGYWIAPSDWGKGYATEAARALITYAFTTLGLHRVQGRHFIRNPASGRVMQKVGMQLEAFTGTLSCVGASSRTSRCTRSCGATCGRRYRIPVSVIR
jgi:RimJ/RimL family protein N-acetyltransferase